MATVIPTKPTAGNAWTAWGDAVDGAIRELQVATGYVSPTVWNPASATASADLAAILGSASIPSSAVYVDVPLA